MSSCRDRKHARTRRRAATARRAVLLALGLGAAGVAGAGCSQQQQPAAPQPKPMDIDAAMQRRDWERSVAWYPNGDVVAGVNRFPLRTYGSTDGGPDLQNALLDFGAAVVQTVALPFTYLVVPPFEKQVFTGDVLPPSYTAMPDMRPAQAPAPDGGAAPDRAAELERLESPEPLPTPAQQRQPLRNPRRGPLGPGDSDFMSSPPTVEEPD